MYDECKKVDDANTFHGVILLDEMSIQQDLQVVKRGEQWEIVGAIDLGPLVNSLDDIHKAKDKIEMASHCFQYLYMSLNGFRWPVAFYASHNVNGHSIYLTFWEIVNVLSAYEITIHAAIMDGSSNNRQFMNLMLNVESARLCRFTTRNPFDQQSKVILMQDCKHVFKKIRNAILSSATDGKSSRTLLLHGKEILWQHFELAYQFNCLNPLRIYRKLSLEHIELNAQAKMRNHLATNVLNSEMLNLFKLYKDSLQDGNFLNSTIELLEHTSVLVDIFSNVNTKIENVHDSRIAQILKVLDFFHDWEEEHTNAKNKGRSLISWQTRQDIDSCLYGFVELVAVASKLNISIVPGYINSDLIENWFCQHRGLRNGFSQHPTLSQIGPATNTNIITGSVMSRKSNTGGKGVACRGVMPPTKKFRAK